MPTQCRELMFSASDRWCGDSGRVACVEHDPQKTPCRPSGRPSGPIVTTQSGRQRLAGLWANPTSSAARCPQGRRRGPTDIVTVRTAAGCTCAARKSERVQIASPMPLRTSHARFRRRINEPRASRADSSGRIDWSALNCEMSKSPGISIFATILEAGTGDLLKMNK